MDDDGRFAQWFSPWLETRPEFSPFGRFVMADLEAAFNAGRADQQAQVLDEILTRSRAIENLLRATDDRPGITHSPPAAGPVPTD